MVRALVACMHVVWACALVFVEGCLRMERPLRPEVCVSLKESRGRESFCDAVSAGFRSAFVGETWLCMITLLGHGAN